MEVLWRTRDFLIIICNSRTFQGLYLFGMTETCALVAGNTTDRIAKPGSIGVPVFNTQMKV